MYPAMPPGFTVKRCLRLFPKSLLFAGRLLLVAEGRLPKPDNTVGFLTPGIVGRGVLVDRASSVLSVAFLDDVSLSNGNEMSRIPSIT